MQFSDELVYLFIYCFDFAVCCCWEIMQIPLVQEKNTDN